ncbi:MAG: gamma-glutamyltransferase [Hyphomicrobiaceae bacterium]|nr:gamma-glutamyltransferase [Hyphomicrobiaceae bacterium]
MMQRLSTYRLAAIGVISALVATLVLAMAPNWIGPQPPVQRLRADAVPTEPRGRISPETASGWTDKPLVIGQRHMVSAAHPLATEAGLEMLRKGGTAVDAAIATQLVLNLVEPQSSGLGGGAFLLHHSARSSQVTTYDGRETAPATATPARFLRGEAPMPFQAAVASGLSVGVPGLLAMLELAHRRHGRLSWADLFQPAIRLAREGFPVSSRMSRMLAAFGKDRFSAAARAYFFGADGAPRPAGALLKNLEFADTLTALAQGGAAAFYQDGPIARAVVAAVAGAVPAGGMTGADIAAYRPVERAALCFHYRTKRICGMPPPSSGGHALGQTLQLLEGFPGVTGPDAAMSPRALHLMAEAGKLAYADRDRYIADPAFVSIPEGLLDPGYIATRRQLIQPLSAMPRPAAGHPPGLAAARVPGRDATIERGGTTHLSVIDAEGNAVAMTSTIEGGFGSGLWAAGFLLNNQLTDFSFRPVDRDGMPVANRVEAGKRPRSSMAPVLVYGTDGRLEAALGSVGGARIPLYVTKALVAMIDWQMDPKAAIDLVNFGSRGDDFEIEFSASTLWQALKVRPVGHRIAADQMTSGTHIVVRRSDGTLAGAADPRRDGLAMGD